ncbi:uncharacterized protein LOC132206273 [Stegostoma tigrinum]|uniref:uncharacterized protein LOC132206273 n=1 Tax=Stegostoma tigrinum TaxID=3053191 RepID=UPI002870494B|nr:uncharacterized protein LOC132206273 [Stegostoma tigrinum]
MEVTDCGVYTCIVKNEVSTSSNSHVLTGDETLFILVAVLFISVVALASSLTSCIGEAIIIIAMKKLSGPNQQRELTAIFVAFQVVSINCLLIASVLAVFESGFSTWCRGIAGFGCLICITVIIYVSVLFLDLNTNRAPSFLTTNIHRLILFLCGILSVAISTVLLHQSKKIASLCQYPYKMFITRSLLAVLVYLLFASISVIYYITYCK